MGERLHGDDAVRAGRCRTSTRRACRCCRRPSATSRETRRRSRDRPRLVRSHRHDRVRADGWRGFAITSGGARDDVEQPLHEGFAARELLERDPFVRAGAPARCGPGRRCTVGIAGVVEQRRLGAERDLAASLRASLQHAAELGDRAAAVAYRSRAASDSCSNSMPVSVATACISGRKRCAHSVRPRRSSCVGIVERQVAEFEHRTRSRAARC